MNNKENKCLILLAHGSPDARWRRPFEQLCFDLQQQHGKSRAKLAYMEFVAPTLLDAVEEAISENRQEIEVFPLFMSAGGHVARDIPEQIRAVQQIMPGLKIVQLPALGEQKEFLALINNCVTTMLK